MIDPDYTRCDRLRPSVGIAGLTLPMKRMVPSFLIVMTFLSLQTVSAVDVYWYQHQACETPQSWKLLHKSGDEWNEVPDASAYETEIDRYNRVTFKPIETTALRIEVQSKPEKWSGILEWKIITLGP